MEFQTYVYIFWRNFQGLLKYVFLPAMQAMRYNHDFVHKMNYYVLN